MLWQVTREDEPLRAAALAGLRRYQHARRAPRALPEAIVARSGRATLRRHAGRRPGRGRTAPLVLVPSLINPPDVLDLSAERSLMRFLGRMGHDALLVDWGTPGPEDRDEGLAAHVANRLLPLLASLPEPPMLLGYCLGGTLAIGAASAMAAMGRPARALVTIAAPWDFAGYAPALRQQIGTIWSGAKPVCERLGLVPMEVLQSGFWALDAERTIRKYADFAALPTGDPREAAFIALEDWANAGAPLTLMAGRELLEECYGANRTGTGGWSVAGTPADPRACHCPTLAIVSSRDRIVPAAAAPWAASLRAVDLGHVGMMIGSSAPSAVWAPLAAWLSLHRAGC